MRSTKALKNGRGREIRTPDILVPNQARYRTALYPEHRVSICQTAWRLARPHITNPRAGRQLEKLIPVIDCLNFRPRAHGLLFFLAFSIMLTLDFAVLRCEPSYFP